MADSNGPYGIGTTTWPGLAKVVEECGELLQVLAKIMATGGLDHSWEQEDGSTLGWGDLTDALHEELGDLQGAINFFTTVNDKIDTDRIIERSSEKFLTFCQWHFKRLEEIDG